MAVYSVALDQQAEEATRHGLLLAAAASPCRTDRPSSLTGVPNCECAVRPPPPVVTRPESTRAHAPTPGYDTPRIHAWIRGVSQPVCACDSALGRGHQGLLAASKSVAGRIAPASIVPHLARSPPPPRPPRFSRLTLQGRATHFARGRNEGEARTQAHCRFCSLPRATRSCGSGDRIGQRCAAARLCVLRPRKLPRARPSEPGRKAWCACTAAHDTSSPTHWIVSGVAGTGPQMSSHRVTHLDCRFS
eukprot:COSAG04_NODE_957_length_9173_cov_27.835133_8_plen_246_part_01